MFKKTVMKNLIKKQREILAIFLYIVLILVLVYVVIIPLLQKITYIKDKIQEEQIKQESNRKHLDELPKFKEQYKMLENVDLEQYLLDKGNAVSLIEKLETLASQTGNKINIAVQEENKNTNVKVKKGEVSIVSDLPSDKYLQLKITLGGDFNSIMKFIKNLENFDYNSDIIMMDIKNRKIISNLNSGNPFSSGEQQGNDGDGKVEAILDTVFYSK